MSGECAFRPFIRAGLAAFCAVAAACSSSGPVREAAPVQAPPPVQQTSPAPVALPVEPVRVEPEVASVAAPVIAAPPDAPAAVEGGDPDTSVFFAHGDATLTPDGRRAIERMAESLRADDEAKLLLIGHANDLGSRSYCLALAAKRIANVRNTLLKLGVRSGQLRRRIVGCESAVDSKCRSEACEKLFRRVAMQVQATGTPAVQKPSRRK